MLIRKFARIVNPFLDLMDFLTPIADLFARVWVAKVFFMAGLVKLQSWESTVALFQYEYTVPLISPYVAAVLGTLGELILPIMLVVGFGGRFVIFILFVYNLIATVSYPHLWTPEGALGLDQHINWGMLLALLMCHGSGKLSVDYWLRQKYGHLFRPVVQ